MDFKYKSVDELVRQGHQQNPPPSPAMSLTQHQSSTQTYFTQQAIRVSAGYVEPHFENKLDHIQDQPANIRETIRREIEKERIREEIIKEEIAHRRMLELEVRRELMIGRQLANQSGEGFSSFSSPLMSFSPTLPFLKQQSDVRSVEERIARSLEDRMGKGKSISGLGARNEMGRLDIVPFEEQISEIPFHQRSVEPKISALKHVSYNVDPVITELQTLLEPSKEKDKIILLAKANASLPGAKRKADTPPLELTSQPLSFSVPKKNGKDEWICALCQVSATSEGGLNDHLNGKKHKSKEASLRGQRDSNNYNIGLFPKKPKTTNLLEANNNLSMEQVVNPKGELLPDNKSGAGLSLVISKEKPTTSKKKKYQFWCATCKIGALSEKSMEEHKVGKKHMARLQELSVKDIAATSAAKAESTQIVNEALEDAGETEVIDDVDAIVDGTNPEEQEEVFTSGDN